MSQRGPIGINGTNNGHAEKPSAAPEQAVGGSAPPTSEEYAGSPRKPKSERENAFDVGGWLVQGLVGLSEELRHSDLGLPEDFWVHAYAARKEALLAARALVDAALEKCAAEDEAAQKTKKSPQRGQVSIDFG
ncbi:MAG: hypothetical protein DWI57_15100 [Chloroflexi bacterium]|nr:MAG: hypothetical protein DWI57_15100 [Chloroflexota bacterium]